jgi:hypothetical protein
LTLTSGMVFSLFALLACWAAVYYFIDNAKKGNAPEIRRIAGLDALDEAIGRATEMGTPIFYSTGRGDVTASSAADTIASLDILGHVATATAKYKCDIIVAVSIANVYPLAEEVVRTSYMNANAIDLFNPEMVQFLSPTQFAYAAACLGIMTRKRIGAAVMMGFFQAESMMLAEGAAQVGAISIAGCSRLFQIPFFVAACDYTLVGEELLAGGAYLSKDAVQTGALAGQDFAKFVAVVLLIVGVLAKTAGNDFLIDLLAK